MKNYLILLFLLLSLTITAQSEDAQLVLKGVQLAKRGKTEKALTNFNKALEINPANIDALYNKGLYLEKKENYNQAIELYSSAINIQPRTILFVRRGDCYQKVEKHKLATADYTKALEAEPEDISIRMSRAYSYIQTEQYDKLLEDLGYQLKRNPQDYSTKANYIMALGQLQRFQEALPLSIELTNEMPDNMMHLAHYLVANNYVKLDQLDNAQKHIQLSFSSDPNYEYAYYASALVQLKRGNNVEACEAYNKSISLGIELDEQEEKELKEACQ